MSPPGRPKGEHSRARPEAAPASRRAAGIDRAELGGVSLPVLAELVRQARSVDEHYRAAAERIGRLYMSADAHRLTALTRCLDEPMRRAAEVERRFAALLQELLACAERRAGTP
jgi:hypothetical protein